MSSSSAMDSIKKWLDFTAEGLLNWFLIVTQLRISKDQLPSWMFLHIILSEAALPQILWANKLIS